MTLDFAHGSADGMSIEAIVLAVGVVLLGAAFLVQKTVDRKVSILLVVVGIAGIIAALTFLDGTSLSGGRSITVQGQEHTEAELGDAVLAICDARDAAQDDPDTANEIFIDRAHVPLHVIVVAVEDDDRALAGRILEAKQKVEQDLIEEVPSEVLARDLASLNDSASLGLERLSMTPPSC